MKQKNQPLHLTNEKIQFSQVRVIADDDSHLGTMTSQQALSLARERQLDLVLVSDKATPPVCRIIDYGKFKYQQEKQQRAKQPHKTKLKELKMRYKIEDHDYSVRVSQAKRFLSSGDSVKVVIALQGRENQHSDLALNLLMKMANDLQGFGNLQQTPQKEGSRMIMLLVPSSHKNRQELEPKPSMISPQLSAVS